MPKKRNPLVLSGLLILLSAGCATTGKYQAKIRSWEGKDSQELLAGWGKPDAIEKLSNGDHMYVYARLKRPPLSYAQEQRTLASSGSAPAPSVYIKCATYFEVAPEGTILSTDFRGDECKSRD